MTARSEPGHAPVLSGLITTISQFTIVTGITILGRLYPSIAHVGSRASSGHVLSAVWGAPSRRQRRHGTRAAAGPLRASLRRCGQ
jgi:hypothetical protein